jgi:hypothetical protein
MGGQQSDKSFEKEEINKWLEEKTNKKPELEHRYKETGELIR